MSSIAADRLKSFVERIERLREEKKAIGSDERDVFSEAKGVGFDTKAMREVLKRRAMDAATRDEWDTLVDTYEHALGLRGEAASIVSNGGTYDQAAQKTGLSRATVARTVASIKNLENETPRDPETGEIRSESAPVAAVQFETPKAATPDSAQPTNGTQVPEVPDEPHPFTLVADVMRGTPPEDDLTPPAFLDRRKQASA